MSCGFVAYCGRPPLHRGHHGGWRTRVRLVADEPMIRLHHEGVWLGSELTPKDLTVMAEYLIHGGYAEAAECLGMAYQTAKNHGAKVLARTGAVSVIQVAYLLGWVTLPDGLGHR